MSNIATLSKDVEDLKKRLRHIEVYDGPTFDTPERILDFLETEFKVKRNVILSETRKKYIVHIRFLGFWLMYHVDQYTTLQVAMLFNKHHATVIHGIQEMNDILYFEDKSGNKKYSPVIDKWREMRIAHGIKQVQ